MMPNKHNLTLSAVLETGILNSATYLKISYLWRAIPELFDLTKVTTKQSSLDNLCGLS
jgi:hypothetical protein